MDEFLYYIRDHLTGTHYFIYSFLLLFFMFAIIGHLFKQKYANFDIKLNTSQKNVKEENKNDKIKKTDIKTLKNEVKTKEKKVVEKRVKSVVNKQSVPTPMPNPSLENKTTTPLPSPNTSTVATPIVNKVVKETPKTEVNNKKISEPIPEIK